MSKYLYNGIELPQLPEWDNTKYPYATITHSSAGGLSQYVLRFTDFKFSAKSNTVANVPEGDNAYCNYKLQNDEWVYAAEGTGWKASLSLTVTMFKWVNYDVLNDTDGSVYLAASDPVPVTVLTARDLYKIINGKPTKLTLYKKLGGKLIPLDEHTKEVNHD